MKVLLTRPKGSNDSMIQSLNQLGIEAIETPLMEIEPVQPCQSDIEQVQQADKIIFISQHAVFHSTSFIDDVAEKPVFAVGQRTAQALKQQGILSFVADSASQDSEGLLVLPELKSVDKQNIVIVRGRGGREKLAKELSARSANVRYCEVYQRVFPKLDEQFVCQRWQQQGIDTILITSGEMLANLLRLVPDEQLEWLKQCRLIVPSNRVVKMAQDAELNKVSNAGGAGESAMLSRLQQFIITH